MNVWKPYLDKLDEDKQQIVLRIMQIAKQCAPESEEVMSYGVPTLKKQGKGIFAVAANKNHFSIYPFGGAAIEANKELLKGLDYSKGTIRFGYDNLPSREIIEALISYNQNNL